MIIDFYDNGNMYDCSFESDEDIEKKFQSIGKNSKKRVKISVMFVNSEENEGVPCRRQIYVYGKGYVAFAVQSKGDHESRYIFK